MTRHASCSPFMFHFPRSTHPSGLCYCSGGRIQLEPDKTNMHIIVGQTQRSIGHESCTQQSNKPQIALVRKLHVQTTSKCPWEKIHNTLRNIVLALIHARMMDCLRAAKLTTTCQIDRALKMPTDKNIWRVEIKCRNACSLLFFARTRWSASQKGLFFHCASLRPSIKT